MMNAGQAICSRNHAGHAPALLAACVLQWFAQPWSYAGQVTAEQGVPLPPPPLAAAQDRQCERREGPFANQATAWQRWRQAQARGFAVSRGVTPCRDRYGARGYCFSVFRPC